MKFVKSYFSSWVCQKGHSVVELNFLGDNSWHVLIQVCAISSSSPSLLEGWWTDGSSSDIPLPSLFPASVSRCLTGLTTMATCVSPLSFWALAPSISSKTTTTCPTPSTKCATWPSSCARPSSVSGVGQGGLGAAPSSPGPLRSQLYTGEAPKQSTRYLQSFYPVELASLPLLT